MKSKKQTYSVNLVIKEEGIKPIKVAVFTKNKTDIIKIDRKTYDLDFKDILINILKKSQQQKTPIKLGL